MPLSEMRKCFASTVDQMNVRVLLFIYLFLFCRLIFSSIFHAIVHCADCPTAYIYFYYFNLLLSIQFFAHSYIRDAITVCVCVCAWRARARADEPRTPRQQKYESIMYLFFVFHFLTSCCHCVSERVKQMEIDKYERDHIDHFFAEIPFDHLIWVLLKVKWNLK